MVNETQTYRRRRVLEYTGFGGAVALAGCTGGSGDDDPDDDPDEGTDPGTDTPSGVDEAADVPKGGTPVVGLSNEPRGFNPLIISDAAAWAIMERFHPYPTARHPEDTQLTAPFVFADWGFDPDALTGWAEITEGMLYPDGDPLTAEDVAFTFNYLMENEGHRYEQNVANVQELEATGDYEIEFSLASEVAAVFTPETGVFAVPTLPKRVWEGVDDYQEFDPLEENDELVGPAGWEWDAHDEGNWYEISADTDAFPDEIHEGPYVDGLRYRVFGDMTSLTNALTSGEVDMTYESITPNRAFQLQDEDGAEVYDSRSRGYNYVAYNMRRVPLDDRPFRQSLGFAFPFNYLQSSLRRGLTETGDYAAAKVYQEWRPDSFDEPFDHGPYKTDDGELDVDRMRSFLEDADGEHDYTFGSVESGQVTGDAEIRVDGELLTDAHTDNDGNGGEGPLGLVVTPPDTSPVEARAMQRFADNLNEVGIPTETQPTAENTQPSLVQGQEDFDMWASGWIWMPKPHFYLGFWLTSNNADVESEADAVHLNPMGYTGADDLIDAAHSTYDEDAQRAATEEALATIYEDAPALITEYPSRIHATSTAFDGWVIMAGGISQNPWSYLNVHQAE